ncbi:hypothetical protein QWZ14_29645, partial [Paeniroseomonas aquatica]|nr:hypothetical protein [Paeniroseomonas aquatica]
MIVTDPKLRAVPAAAAQGGGQGGGQGIAPGLPGDPPGTAPAAPLLPIVRQALAGEAGRLALRLRPAG